MLKTSEIRDSKRCVLLPLNAQRSSGLNLHDGGVETCFFFFSVVPSQRMHLLRSVGDGFCLEM